MKSQEKLNSDKLSENVAATKNDRVEKVIKADAATKFDFSKIKIVIKRPKEKENEIVYLDRNWSK